MNGTQLSLFGHSNAGPSSATTRNDVRTGDAAETLVIYRLLMLDYDAHNSRRDAAYDVVVDLHNGRVLRIQVKSCSKAVRGRLNYRFVRGNPRTGAGSYLYAPTDFDITACVAVPLDRVIFVPGVHAKLSMRTEHFLRPRCEAESWQRALCSINRTN